MMYDMDAANGPCIVVNVKGPVSTILREVLAGIEEEGIPYGLYRDDDAGDVIKRTYKAAYYSKMGIAVGVEGTRVILHHDKIKETSPLIDMHLKYYEMKKARKIGNNAARLYKAMPFKSMDGLNEGVDIDGIKAHVIAVLNSTWNKEGYK